MSQLDFNKIVKVLSRKSSRAILRSILNDFKTVKQIREELEGTEASLKYRESVYKALEKLVSTGLVEKIQSDGGVKYRSHYSDISADFLNEELKLEEIDK